MDKLEIKLEEARDEKPAIRFLAHVGLPGICLYLLTLVIAGAQFFLAYEYTFYFQNRRYGYAFVFIVFFVTYMASFAYQISRWKYVASKFNDSNYKTKANDDDATYSSNNDNQAQNDKAQKSDGTRTKIRTPHLIRIFFEWKSNFQLNGRWYLVKMYMGEVAEIGMQLYNMVYIFSCSLPKEMMFAFSTYLCLKNFALLHIHFRPYTVGKRDFCTTLDTATDIFCMVFPLFFMGIVVNIPISLYEMLSIVTWPSLSMLMKLDELMEQNVLRRTHNEIHKAQTRSSRALRRNRLSIFRQTEIDSVIQCQIEAIPKSIGVAYTICLAIGGVAFFVLGIMQFAVTPSCSRLWEENCAIKVPHCGVLFQPTCNCAVLTVLHHNYTTLPSSIDKMNQLKRLRVNYGPLQQLPHKVFHQLTELNADFNAIEKIPDTIAKSKDLIHLYASFNRVNYVSTSVWHHERLRYIDLSTNNISYIPENTNMESLTTFLISNNSLRELPTALFVNNKNMIRFHADGNLLTKLPGVMGTSLHTLGLSRNNLTNFPSDFLSLQYLSLLDVRNNTLEELPSWFNHLEALENLIVAQNPLCTNGWVDIVKGKLRTLVSKDGEGCSEQCSPMCLNFYLENSGCDFSCNVPSCNYDNGKC